ncbi:MAG: carbohydrate binding family 9 domain-containing protein [Acidobacteria bacterium]|nr:carbohydrate binding family 9 domain-containing protein [Acidobacteriota bacterium]
MTAVRAADDERILVDGVLDEEVWQRATPATDFLQFDPLTGEPATERTEVRIVYTRSTFYMGVRCFDSEPNRLLRFQRRRDEFLQSDDRFMWVIDPFLSAQNGYFFETNPSGLMGDALLGPGINNRQWDGLWNLAVHRDDTGWSFEIAIPFTTLNFDPKADTWGINFQRTVRRKNEESLWYGWARNQGLQRLSNTGLLTGMNQQVSQGLGLDLRPFGVVTADASPGTGAPDTAVTRKAGIDLFYSVTPGLRANFTVNTDFAQTEVDQRQVNLTQFPLFFPEKRAFFLEGASFFDFGTAGSTDVLPFFSRRIGLDDSGEPRPIVYGAKLIGQIGSGDVGVLHVRTAESGGVPGENFSVLRAKQRRRQSYLGGLFAARQPGGNAGARETAGVDFQLATSEFRGRMNLSFAGYALHTTNPNAAGRSGAYELRVDYPNDRWEAGMAYRRVDGNFTPSMGFTLRTGYQRYNPRLRFNPRPAHHPFIRLLGFGGIGDLQTDMDSALTNLWTLTLLSLDTHGQDRYNFILLPEYERLNAPFSIYPGITLPIGGEYSFTRYRVAIATANRRLLAVSPKIEWGHFYSGTREQYIADVTARLRPGVIVYSSAEFNRVRLKEGAFETRVYRLSPELQFNQWVSLVNTVQYDSVSAVLGWQSRFRWILTPGDDLYVVYVHNWLNDSLLDRWSTLNRRAASKIIYTKRF